MERIVSTGLEVDFHIHSYHSFFKEAKNLTANNTEANLNVLISALISNHVNMCAITDHDCFSFEMYNLLKKNEGKHGLQKVLPGVEFSVRLHGENPKNNTHVIALFDDTDEAKLHKIETTFGCGTTLKPDGTFAEFKPIYDQDGCFSEEFLIRKLDDIGLNVVLIAHQKQSLLSDQDPKKHDLLDTGQDTFNQFLYSEYFQSLEFHDRKNELFNSKAKRKYPSELLRFITGSDCHDWTCYPRHDKNVADDKFEFTYFKCLPTFRGVALALTEDSRVNLVNSFFGASTKSVNEIDLAIDGNEYRIPMSKGINAIIGDNSIGKSLLLHKMTDYYRQNYHSDTSSLKSAVVKGYDKYLQDNHVVVKTIIPKDNIYMFDTQGEIRQKFSQQKLKDDDFFKDKFPANETIAAGKQFALSFAKEAFDAIKGRFDLHDDESQLAGMTVSVPLVSLSASVVKGIQISIDSYNKALKDLATVAGNFKIVYSDLENLKKSIDPSDADSLNTIIKSIKILEEKYKVRERQKEKELALINCVNNGLQKFSEEQSEENSQTDADKAIEGFDAKKEALASLIVKMILARASVVPPTFPVASMEIKATPTPYLNYRLITKCKTSLVDASYLRKLLDFPLKANRTIDFSTITKEWLEDSISRLSDGVDSFEQYKAKIRAKIDDDFQEETNIVECGEDGQTDHSAGRDDQLYFGIIATDKKNDGIYLIDQPEDDVSPKAIKKSLLTDLSEMRKIRQVILITHNPQFVVNLDADNVIYLHKEKDAICIDYGALEYKDETTDILRDVALTLDGGVKTIRKRWKRYDKDPDDFADN